MAWHMGDIFDRLGTFGDQARPALIHGERRLSWGELTARSNRIARNLAERGVPTGAKIAFYMRNRPEYMELLVAALKGRFTHVNINYRYRPQELAYILDDSDAAVVVYAAEFRPVVDAVRAQCAGVATWVEIGDAPRPADTIAYEALAGHGDGAPLGIARDGDDMVLVYTGGTTGMPKGVVWTHDIMVRAQIAGLMEGAAPTDIDGYMAHVRERGADVVQLPAAPLMHLTGMGTALTALMGGGTVVTVPAPDGFDAAAIWDAVARERVTSMAIVGDAFARPLLAALQAAPGGRDLSSLRTIISSGVMWSTPVKAGLLDHLPGVTLLDALASSEAPAIAATASSRETGIGATLDFSVGPDCRVLDEDGRPILQGSGQVGRLARAGNMPLGYYKDERKTAETFRTVDGVRYALTGDMCRVEADGRITLLGRSAACINTGGEKVFAEEVEEALKEHPVVDDAAVLGVPDDRWGQAVVAVIALRDGAAFDEAALRDHVRAKLAAYKAPRRILVKDTLERFPNGKANYAAMRDFTLARLAVDPG